MHIRVVFSSVHSFKFKRKNNGFKRTSKEIGSLHLFYIVCFTDLDQGSEIISRFNLHKSMKHTINKNESFQSVLLPKSVNSSVFEIEKSFVLLFYVT